jgi:hypothetical protein
MAGRTVIVGDVHGCFDELTDLFEKVRLQPADHLVMIGDTVVKGPKPREVLRCVLARPRTTCLLGNMEWRLLEACDRGLQHRLPRAHLETLQTLQGGWDEIEASMRTWPLTLDLGDVLCIHAGLRPGRSLAEQPLHDLLHLRRVKVGGVCGPTTAKPWWEPPHRDHPARPGDHTGPCAGDSFLNRSPRSGEKARDRLRPPQPPGRRRVDPP